MCVEYEEYTCPTCDNVIPTWLPEVVELPMGQNGETYCSLECRNSAVLVEERMMTDISFANFS